jgi:hypothetical protein
VPAGAVEQKSGVGSLGGVAGDFIEVKLHGVGVGKRQRGRSSDASHGAIEPATIKSWAGSRRASPFYPNKAATPRVHRSDLRSRITVTLTPLVAASGARV